MYLKKPHPQYAIDINQDILIVLFTIWIDYRAYTYVRIGYIRLEAYRPVFTLRMPEILHHNFLNLTVAC